jgi:hypothetical protein
MPRILTKLRIDEVSAVDRGAGDGVKIVLMKRDDQPRSKPHVERHERRLRKFEDVQRAFPNPRSFNAVLARMEAEALAKSLADEDDGNVNIGASDHHASSKVADLLVESGRFPHRAAALDHLLNSPHGNALLARLHKAAEQTDTRKGETMRTDNLESILKDCGPVRLCKGIVDRGRAPCSETELVAGLTKYAASPGVPPDVAFAKLYEAEESVRRACSIAKAAEFSVEPQVFGLPAMNPDHPTDMLAAYNEILRTIREQFPYRTGAQQLAMADEELARQHHVRPQANYANVYAMPLETRSTEKRDGATGGAYAELLAKARELQAATGMSEAQAFTKVYTDRANVELAKRERVESAPR